MPLFVNVLSLKDLCESIFHKAIKEAKLTMQTKAGWEMRTTHFNVLVPTSFHKDLRLQIVIAVGILGMSARFLVTAADSNLQSDHLLGL